MSFWAIRSNGKHNNNPNAVQFSAAFKRLVVLNEVKDIASGNCLPQDCIQILTVSSAAMALSAQDIINSTSERRRLLQTPDDETVDTSQDPLGHNYCPDPGHISECGGRIVTYIAGHVVRGLQKTLVCEICFSDLIITPSDCPTYSLIRHKTMGRLLYPSDSIVRIARRCQKVFRTTTLGNRLGVRDILQRMVTEVLQNCLEERLFPSAEDHMYIDGKSLHSFGKMHRAYVSESETASCWQTDLSATSHGKGPPEIYEAGPVQGTVIFLYRFHQALHFSAILLAWYIVSINGEMVYCVSC